MAVCCFTQYYFVIIFTVRCSNISQYASNLGILFHNCYFPSWGWIANHCARWIMAFKCMRFHCVLLHLYYLDCWELSQFLLSKVYLLPSLSVYGTDLPLNKHNRKCTVLLSVFHFFHWWLSFVNPVLINSSIAFTLSR